MKDERENRMDDAIQKTYVSLSAKRQIAIPPQYLEQVGIDTEAECFVRGDEIILRAIQTKKEE